MSKINNELKNKYKTIIEPQYSINFDGSEVTFEYLVRGYGAKNGMLVDSSWGKISPYSELLVTMGYGFSCLDLNDLESFEQVLKDWGKFNT